MGARKFSLWDRGAYAPRVQCQSGSDFRRVAEKLWQQVRDGEAPSPARGGRVRSPDWDAWSRSLRFIKESLGQRLRTSARIVNSTEGAIQSTEAQADEVDRPLRRAVLIKCGISPPCFSIEQGTARSTHRMIALANNPLWSKLSVDRKWKSRVKPRAPF